MNTETQQPTVPDRLLRFFSTTAHASSFIEGDIRLGSLDAYRVIEGLRRDDSEGQPSFYWNQKAPQIILDKMTGKIVGGSESDKAIHYRGSSLNTYFVLSTSHPEANIRLLATRFGSHVVCINDPLELLNRMKKVWQSHPWALPGSGLIRSVVYDKNELLPPDPYLLAPQHYVYAQKPKTFVDEKEWRYVLTCAVNPSVSSERFLTLRLPDCRDICCISELRD